MVKDHLESYLSMFPPMQRGKLRKALEREQGLNGEIAPRYVHAERLARLPELRIDAVKGRLYTTQDRFFDVSGITQALADYAIHLKQSSAA